MVRLAPRLSPRLVAEVERLDDGKMPIAELGRRIGEAADRMALPRPSYERIRQIAHAKREWRARRGPSTAEVLLEVAFRARPPEALLDHLSGVGLSKR